MHGEREPGPHQAGSLRQGYRKVHTAYSFLAFSLEFLLKSMVKPSTGLYFLLLDDTDSFSHVMNQIIQSEKKTFHKWCI